MPRCTLCGRGDLEPFLDVADVPVHVGVLWPSAAEARSCSRGDLALALCPVCGFVTNTAFDEGRIDYSQKYDNALHGSPVFQAFEEELVAHLADRYDLAGATVVEIGCGSGHFLGLLCGKADARGIGYDPSHDPEHADPLAAGCVDFVSATFDPAQAAHDVDLLVCRQTLEHVADARGFLAHLRAALGSGSGVLYLDVPNSTMPFASLSIWDLIYEHVHYFVADSLRYALASSGFDVLDLRETFHGQFLSVEARVDERAPERARPSASDELVATVRAFGQRFRERRELWLGRLAEYRRTGRRVVVWGGGARAVSFFTMLGIDDEIGYVVDVNPRKQGSFLGGAGQEIVAPEFLRAYRPETVVVLNPLYEDEIGTSLRELGVDAEVVIA